MSNSLSTDLETVANLLSLHLGTDFARSAAGNKDNHVAPVAIRTIAAPPPTVDTIEDTLEKIARNYGVTWSPGPRRQEILNVISELLDPQGSPVVDMAKLRQICSRGIPDEPSWIRPRIWKLFLGILPVLKASWEKDITKQRESYYDLIKRLLDPFSSLPPPTQPPTTLDSLLLGVSKQLSAIPFTLFEALEAAPEAFESCPLDDNAIHEIKINSARNLDMRVNDLRALEGSDPQMPNTPEIRIEPETRSTPDISLSSPDAGTSDKIQGSTTLLSFKSGILVLNQEIVPEDLAHAEADTFWLFEAMVGEFSELEDEEGGSVWMKKFGERMSWADPDLFQNLYVKGLDPAMPHYSYRWLAPLLTHTLPMTSVLPVWDVLFSRPTRTRDTNPKIEQLLDICIAMLIRARAPIFRLGKGGRKSPSLWAEEANALPPPSPLRAWELGDAFLEGISLLQLYPLEAAGGIDRILHTALDLGHRRDEESRLNQKDNLSLGARLKATMWKGFTNQESSPETSSEEFEEEVFSDEESPEDGNETETPDKREPGLTSRLATTVWRGITNQSSMESSSSPLSPPSPLPPSSPSTLSQELQDMSSPKSSLWAYADKLKDSDAAATLAKVSTNWRAKAILGSWGRPTSSLRGKELPAIPQTSTRSESVSEGYITKRDDGRRGSLPPMDRSGVYSPPPRPLYFRPPRDSFIFPQGENLPLVSPEQNIHHETGFIERTRSLQSSLAALTKTSSTSQSSQPTKSGPRPLLLSPSTPITSPPSRPISRSAGSTPTPDHGEWAHVMRVKGHNLHRDSQSSMSSLSPSDAFRPIRSSRTECDSDTGTSGSRRVALNRKSISPMAPGSRTYQGRPFSGSSTASSDRGLASPSLSTQDDIQGWNHVEVQDSPPLTSPPASKSPSGLQSQGCTVPTSDPSFRRDDAENSVQAEKMTKTTIHSSQYQMDDTSDSSLVHVPSSVRNPRIRSKRYNLRPPNLKIQDDISQQRPTVERKPLNPNTLAVELPHDDQDVARTPKASHFNADDFKMATVQSSSKSPSSKSPRRSRKVSTETQERLRNTSVDSIDIPPRKFSTGQRTRKVFSEKRESSAEEGDDEGYDDLLSAYESEVS
ncbi:hypothetical protein H0H81_006797 [Sphagnurus paluster]|uniref:Rab-GAP TBC domain-containing protein n=1 Tax=Sphagnurus paluster TaxID=117069 RepID=A0A9P7K557_9AGAR|nr:hypothetical protein H0H81_006797 [Sphagnurus paluster]